MLQENGAVADSRRRKAELDYKLTLSDFFDFTVSSMSKVWGLVYNTQRETQLTTVAVSKVHDMLT